MTKRSLSMSERNEMSDRNEMSERNEMSDQNNNKRPDPIMTDENKNIPAGDHDVMDPGLDVGSIGYKDITVDAGIIEYADSDKSD